MDLSKVIVDHMEKFKIKLANPFESDLDFDNFIYQKYSPAEISEEVLANINLNNPLNMYKYILVNINPIFVFDKDVEKPEIIQTVLKKFKDIKEKYAEFQSKKIPISERESKFLKSAVAALELAELMFGALEKTENHKMAFCYVPGTVPHMENEIVDLRKLKKICSDILEGDNPLGEGLVTYTNYLKTTMLFQRTHEIIRFILCVSEEGLKRSLKVKTENGLIKENKCMESTMETLSMTLNAQKLTFLAKVFDVSSTLYTIGADPSLEMPAKDEKDGKFLMKLFENCEDVDDFYRIPMKIKTFEQAKQTFELMLEMASRIEPSKDLNSKNHHKEYFEGLAHCYFAAYHPDPEEIYRFSEDSLKFLESAQNKRKDQVLTRKDQLLAAIDLNLRRMWNIKYDQYLKHKTEENRIKLLKLARRKIDWIDIFLKQINNVRSCYHGWWTCLDLAKCTLLVYKDERCAKAAAHLAYNELIKKPNEILIFNNNYKGIKLHLNMSEEAFIEAVFKKFDPNNEFQKKNPFEDGTGYEDFVCFPYYETPPSIFARAALDTPLNIYKFLIMKVFAVFNDDYLPGKFIMDEIKKVKKTYKEFVKKEISMTLQEKKYVRSAYGTLRLAEMYYKYCDETAKFNEADLNNFDLHIHKLKDICSSILDSFAQEVPLFYLSKILFKFIFLESHETCKFLACTMNEVKRKTRAVREQNGALLKCCSCVLIQIKNAETDVIFANLCFLEDFFVLCACHNTIQFSEEESTLTSPKESERGKMLMKLFENFEGAEEFLKNFKRVDNYDQAKVMFDFILKLINEYKSTKEVQNIFESLYFEGMAYNCLAAFVEDSSEVYELCEKSSKLLQECTDFERNRNKIQDVTKIDHIIGATNENYRRMWHIKFDIYTKEKTQKNLQALQEVAEKRIELGTTFMNDLSVTDWTYPRWWVCLDLLKCHLQVNKDKNGAKKCAEELHKELIRNPKGVSMFNSAAGVQFVSGMSKKNFTDLIVRKFAKQN